MRKDFLTPAATVTAALINARQETEAAPTTEQAVQLYMDVLNSMYEAYRTRKPNPDAS